MAGGRPKRTDRPYEERAHHAESVMNFYPARWRCPGCGCYLNEERFRRAGQSVCIMCQVDRGGKAALALLSEPFDDTKWRDG